MAQFDGAIPPGGEGAITLKVSLNGYQGKIKKSAVVYSDDPKNGRVTLVFQGTVKAMVEIRPTNTISFRGLADQVPDKVIDIVGSNEPFHIKSVETNLEGKIGTELTTVEEGKQYQLKVSNRLKQGNYNGLVRLLTDLPKKPDLIIRVSGYIEGEVAVRPQTLLVGRLASQQPPRVGKVLVVSNRKKEFKITHLGYDEKLVSVSSAPNPGGEPGYTLDISPKLENVAPGARVQTTLTIETDVNPAEKQEVQVYLINVAEGAPKGGASLPERESADVGPKTE